MRLLIIGGTVFLGRGLVDAARARGHAVTLFNRGQSNPGLYPDVEQVHGDRTRDLGLLAGRAWDAVIDTCGYVPRVVRLSAQALAGIVDHYTFISSISVYRDLSQPGADERAAVGELADPMTEEVTGETYGPLKVLSERAADAEMPGRALIIRPGLIVGPHDPTDRFTYWPYRVSQGGQVLAPGEPGSHVQFIDVRDLAEWIVRMVEARATGVYNATGPAAPLTMGDLLQTCKTVSGSDAVFVWVPADFLIGQGVSPWADMPMWLPETDPSTAGFQAVSVDKAIAAGLTFRPLSDTVAATLAWLKGRPADRPWRAGVTSATETELLQAWQQANVD
jgi:2'-hydroxyisoflavone reductase